MASRTQRPHGNEHPCSRARRRRAAVTDDRRGDRRRVQLMTIEERDLRIAGRRIRVRLVGHGRPVLLLNGHGAHVAMWGPLEQTLEGFQLIEFDAPGTGGSRTPPYPISIPALASLAARVLDEVDVSTADVIGYSMGGMVAQQLAASQPQRVRRLVLV